MVRLWISNEKIQGLSKNDTSVHILPTIYYSMVLHSHEILMQTGPYLTNSLGFMWVSTFFLPKFFS